MLVYDGDLTIGRLLREEGTFEERSVGEVVRFLSQRHDFQPRLFVDVGANIGMHLIHALRHGMFLDGVGIEMDENNFRLLTCNVMLNLRCQPQLLRRALSDRCGAILMECSPDNFGDHRIVMPGTGARSLYNEADRAVMEVPATTLDLLASEAGLRIDDTALVWIDTQGHEGHVLAGARGILAAAKPPRVVCEFWPYGLERAGGRELFFNFLEHARIIHNISAAGWETAEPLTAADLHEMYGRLLGESSRDRYPHIELLCVL
jgi:FkbM family methyltransferase